MRCGVAKPFEVGEAPGVCRSVVLTVSSMTVKLLNPALQTPIIPEVSDLGPSTLQAERKQGSPRAGLRTHTPRQLPSRTPTPTSPSKPNSSSATAKPLLLERKAEAISGPPPVPQPQATNNTGCYRPTLSQTLGYSTLFNKIYPDRYLPKCSSCKEWATLTHILWRCEDTPTSTLLIKNYTEWETTLQNSQKDAHLALVKLGEDATELQRLNKNPAKTAAASRHHYSPISLQASPGTPGYLLAVT